MLPAEQPRSACAGGTDRSPRVPPRVSTTSSAAPRGALGHVYHDHRPLWFSVLLHLAGALNEPGSRWPCAKARAGSFRLVRRR